MVFLDDLNHRFLFGHSHRTGTVSGQPSLHLLTSGPNAIIGIVGHPCNFVCSQRLIACNICNKFFLPVLTRQTLTTITVTRCILPKWTEMIKTVHHISLHLHPSQAPSCACLYFPQYWHSSLMRSFLSAPSFSIRSAAAFFSTPTQFFSQYNSQLQHLHNESSAQRRSVVTIIISTSLN